MKKIAPLFAALLSAGTVAATVTSVVSETAWGQTGTAQPVSAAPAGAPITYQLPPTPDQTYTVTLAITDAKNPDWIVCTFLSGMARTVTAENKGRFTDYWNGLDENLMPVPPGKYGVKGIFMPAKKWLVDDEYHAVTPQYVAAASAWAPAPLRGTGKEPRLPYGGDPVGQPMSDIAVGSNGVAVFYYEYLENGTNNPMIDLKKPMGYDQFLRAFNSGSAGGGSSTATDGDTVWSFSTEGGRQSVYRADQKPFGKSPGSARKDTLATDGWVTSMAAWRDTAAGKSYLYIAQGAKMVPTGGRWFTPSRTEVVDKVTVHDGDNANTLAELPLQRPTAIVARDGLLYALHGDGAGWAVSSVKLTNGLPQGTWQRAFAVPANITPSDLEVDSRGRFYLSDPKANKVYQLDGKAKITLTYGRLAEQKPGAYDPLSFMGPTKLATWKDPEGNDRLLVLERDGPNRTAEWSSDGKLLRDFLTYQTKCNDGYTYDPEHPEMVYVPGQNFWLTRFKVDYESGKWTVDAVWPNVGNNPGAGRMAKPQFIRANGQSYLASEKTMTVYRMSGDRWVLSAGVIRKPAGQNQTNNFLWHDANNNNNVDTEEMTPVNLPGHIFTYHGQNWLNDLSYVAIAQGSKDVWRIVPGSFDEHGNPIFKAPEKLLTDPVFVARAAGKADATHGGNELADSFSSDWAQVDGSLADGFYVQARGGKGFSANGGAQYKISRYVPDGKGGYAQKWRVGRSALSGTARNGEMYGAMRIHRAENGIVSVIDQSRMGVVLYTDDGLYVDTLFCDIKRVGAGVGGIYQQGGEFFAGSIFTNKDNGKIYLALGKYTPTIFETPEWTLKTSPVRRLTDIQKEVTISTAQISAPPEIALSLRGGAGSAKFARFGPAIGEVALDGSMTGWDSASPITFSADKNQTVTVRGLYRPDQLLLRWNVRLADKFVPKAMPPLEQIFAHDQESDTVSFYIQGDVNAAPGGPTGGRSGDVRLVFGIFNKDGKLQPVALGLYPEWRGPGARPQQYRTPVGTATFAHGGAIPGIELAHKLDADGKGFVLTAAIPRAAIPRLDKPFSSSLKTLVNFEATLSGHNKFWWSNSDGSASTETFDAPTEARLYPGSWAPLQLTGIEGGLMVRNWLVAGPFGGPGAEKFNWNLDQAGKDAARRFYEAATYPPDGGNVDPSAVYSGPMVRGWWRDPGKVTWKPRAVADLDVRVPLFDNASVGYAATWVHVPEDTELDFKFQGHKFTALRWFFNGEPIKGLVFDNKTPGPNPVAIKKMTLNAGWNQIFVRGYSTAYAPVRVGLIFDGPPEKLTTLTLSTKPTPEMVGTATLNEGKIF